MYTSFITVDKNRLQSLFRRGVWQTNPTIELSIWTPFWCKGVGIWTIQSLKVQMPGVCLGIWSFNLIHTLQIAFMYIQCIFFSDLTNSRVLFCVMFNLNSLLLLEIDNNIPGYFPLLLKIPSRSVLKYFLILFNDSQTIQSQFVLCLTLLLFCWK